MQSFSAVAEILSMKKNDILYVCMIIHYLILIIYLNLNRCAWIELVWKKSFTWPLSDIYLQSNLTNIFNRKIYYVLKKNNNVTFV